MHIIPVIDLLDGRVVRAVRGDRSRYRPIESTVCPGSAPVPVALRLCEHCATSNLYVADLDALQGRPAQIEVLRGLLHGAAAGRALAGRGLRRCGRGRGAARCARHAPGPRHAGVRQRIAGVARGAGALLRAAVAAEVFGLLKRFARDLFECGGGVSGGAFFPQVVATRAAAADEQAYVISDNSVRPEHTRPSFQRAAIVSGLCLLLWVVPLLLLGWWRGWAHVFFQDAVFFSKAAMVTFGGAYAVLPYVAQQAVEQFGWLTPAQMFDGLGLAETTPGPLIMVLQFVGFMAGWHHAQNLGLWGAVLGGLIATYFTFMPCFFWIFLGAPYMEQIRGNRFLSGACGCWSPDWSPTLVVPVSPCRSF